MGNTIFCMHAQVLGTNTLRIDTVMPWEATTLYISYYTLQLYSSHSLNTVRCIITVHYLGRLKQTFWRYI